MNLINKLTLKSTLAAAACIAAMSFSTANACTGVLNGNTNAVGTHNGYYYSFWKQTGGSRVNITCGEGGNYSTDWSGVFNWVGGKGWKPGGARVVSYSGSFNNGRNRGSSNSYLALYGWTHPPKEVEYYVIESFGSYNPSSCGGKKGSYQSDGATYDIVECTRTNQPSISGTSTFQQYFSVRNPPKPWGDISGTITVKNHFDAWAKAGMQLGTNFDYMVLATEGYDGGNNSSGNSNLRISEGPGQPVSCGTTGGVEVCCNISADPDGDGMGTENNKMCMVTDKTVGYTPPNPADVLAAINVGGTAEALQINNIWYAPNQYVTGGTPNSTTSAISGNNSDIYKSEMYGDLTIDIPMSNQSVSVELGFVELYQTTAGMRSFNVSIENQAVMSNVDIFAEVGGNTVWKPAPFIVNVTDGKLTIKLTTIEDNATLSSVLVRKSTAPVSSSSRASSSSSAPRSSSSSSVRASSSSSSAPASTAGSANGLLLLVLGGLVFTRRFASKR